MAFEFLGELIAVAEIPQGAADRDGLLPIKPVDAVVARGRRAGEDALTDPPRGSFGERFTTEAEHQHGDPRASIRRLIGAERPFDGGLGIAGDHAGRVAAHLAAGGPGPPICGRRDDQPHADHCERLGKRVGHGHAVELQHVLRGPLLGRHVVSLHWLL